MKLYGKTHKYLVCEICFFQVILCVFGLSSALVVLISTCLVEGRSWDDVVSIATGIPAGRTLTSLRRLSRRALNGTKPLSNGR
jgi:hypothetical protein